LNGANHLVCSIIMNLSLFINLSMHMEVLMAS
jgi:hypothetical protein